MRTLVTKKLSDLTILLLFIAGAGMVSCNEEVSNPIADLSEEITGFEDEQDTDDALDESDVFNTLDVAKVPSGGRVTDENPADSAYSCATYTHDKENKIITIDFGEGCVGLDGILRSGKIIITYTDHYLVPGAIITKTFEDFHINEHHVEGFITVTNISASLGVHPQFSVILEGGKVTFEDETVATRDSDFEITWINASNPLNDEYHKEGTASGMRSDVEYTMTITSVLIKKNICKLDGVHIPVAGEKFIEREGLPDLTINYGDGECDNTVTITRDDGVSREVEHNRRFRRRGLGG